MKHLAQRIAATGYGQRVLGEEVDWAPFKQNLTPRMYLGLVLWVLNYVLGWPCVALFAALAAYFKRPMILVIGGPAIYGFSWLVLLVAAYLTGTEGKRYLAVIVHHLVRKLLLRHA